jgi:hypothetical protein
MRSSIALVFILVLAASGLFMVESASAQLIPEPSIPEFTVQTQTQADTTAITLTIRNQPFDVASQSPDGFFYNVAISIDGKNWSELYHVEDAQDWYPQQSNSSSTVLTYVAGETIYYPRDTGQGVGVIPKSGEVAFQVQAMIGHRDRGAFQNGSMPYVLVGETSGWSNTQTITIPNTSTPSSFPSISPSTSPTQQPTGEPIQTASPTLEPKNSLNYLPIITAIIIVIIIAFAGILFYFKKIKK